MTIRRVPLETVRRAMADCWAGAPEPGSPAGASDSSERLGTVTLRPHQVDALEQLSGLLRHHGGALLADAVGTGKTYIGLAVAARASRVVVVCPAGLRELWRTAASDAGVTIARASMETLSRLDRSTRSPLDATAADERRSAAYVGGGDAAHERDWLAGRWTADLVIIDEAHHFRNTHTRRYRALAHLTSRSRVLLLTATPVHNRPADLAALLSFFLGARAWRMTEDERAHYVVRRDAALIQAGPMSPRRQESSGLLLPTVVGPCVVSVGDDATTLAAIAALPPPVPPCDGETSAALAAMGLVRQWASSTGALRAALRRRLERAVALEASLEQGVYPSYRDLREWCLGDGAIQLAFPDLLVSRMLPDVGLGGAGSARSASDLLLEAVRSHAASVRELLRRLGTEPSIDGARAERLRAIVRAHGDSQVVAFSAFEDTVHALYRLLQGAGGVCALSARGGLIASGRIRRAEVIEQFAPGAAAFTPKAERVQLLITTDLLSEGLNLQAAGVVVHLDLPWTPARLEQRVGRIARLGSTHRCVHVYAFAPPVAAEVLLQTERRLRAKLDAAKRAVGIAGTIVPAVSAPYAPAAEGSLVAPAAPARHGDTPEDPQHTPGPPECLAMSRAVLRRWRGVAARSNEAAETTLWSAARSPAPGMLAACRAGGETVLVVEHEGRISDAPAAVARALQWADGAETIADETRCHDALRAVRAWWIERCAGTDMGLSATAGSTPSRRRVLSRIAAISRRCPPHARPSILALGERARRAAAAPLGAGAESGLGELAGARLPDIQWLRAVAAFAEASATLRHTATGAAPATLDVRAIIVFSDR